LATFAGGNVQSGKVYPRALEAFLDAVMGTRSGIPQGPAASEVFAAAYLMPLDQKMSEHGWKYVRYADDFLIGADSVTDGRRKLGRLEEALHEIGLRLNSSKTLIMRTPTYLAGLRGNPRQDEFRSKIREIADSLSSEPPSADEDESESEFFNEDELNFLEEPYRETVTLDEVLEDVSGKVNPLLVEAYGVYLKRTAESLGNSPSRDNDLGNLERDLRECLTVVTASRHEVDLAAIDRVLRWFPKLAEYVAAYLRSAAPNFPLPVVEMLRDWLRPDADIDWVTAWLTYVAEAAPRLVDAGLEELLQKLALNPSVGVLTRSGAIRALAAARKLDTKTWSEALNGASSAMRAELILSRLANPDRYPGQSAEIESE